MNGFAQSLIAFTLTAFIFFRGTSLEDGHAVGLFFMGTVIFAGIVLTCVLKAALLIKYLGSLVLP